ncbi:transcriptional regulator [Bacillus sp. SA1-12]|uniref:TetR/AcrR family transcriptional regulator n=1 Tax=Bacillus sp. SA1-12 TaxID=1455638 RepID=UPI00062730F9|nr:TetR/AcrR family transcriptional regulator [Bacillus sp. SA1-12]KKI90072.1 transcriptional regulator [Bacillus sp. SA1-12]
MESQQKLSNSDKMMIAAINLISEKGYNSVTTKEIAEEAGFSEKTLFRHFGSKQNLLETAFKRFHYSEEMKTLYNEKLVWDLQTDLLLISRKYHELMNRNRKMIQISIKEAGNLPPGFLETTQEPPKQFLDILTQYFSRMQEMGKMIQSKADVQALSFMFMNFGAFMNNLDHSSSFTTVSLDEFVTESVQLFARALTP